MPNKNTAIPHFTVAPTPAREGRWKRHLAAQVPVIEHVTPAPDSVHAASAPVVEYLAPVIECESSSSSAAHAALTRTDDIDEKLTNMINMLDSCREIFSPLVSRFEQFFFHLNFLENCFRSFDQLSFFVHSDFHKDPCFEFFLAHSRNTLLFLTTCFFYDVCSTRL